MCIFTLLSHRINILFSTEFLSLSPSLSPLSLSLPHMHGDTSAEALRQAPSAWYLSNSFVGPGWRPWDHNVERMLISAYMMRLGRGEVGVAIPIPVITPTPAYCAARGYRGPHYWIILYSGLIKACKSHKCGCTLHWKCKCCLAEMARIGKHLILSRASNKIAHHQIKFCLVCWLLFFFFVCFLILVIY